MTFLILRPERNPYSGASTLIRRYDWENITYSECSLRDQTESCKVRAHSLE